MWGPTAFGIGRRLKAEIGTQWQRGYVRERLAANGAGVVASSPEQFTAYIAGELAKWEKVIKAAGIRGD